LRLTGKSKRRTRRPTTAELNALLKYFKRRDQRVTLPMVDLVNFALYSARREGEICRLEWEDNDAVARSGMVRDAKHPTHKEGNHRRFKYTAEAWAIVERQPQTGEYIFPYDPKSISAAFTRACHVLAIQDLRFHDLRHEATSRLFERGYHIHEVAQFTLHESWNELRRYTNLKPENVRDLQPIPESGLGVPRVTQLSFSARRSKRLGRPRLLTKAIFGHQGRTRDRAASSLERADELPRS
jgi:integrase